MVDISTGSITSLTSSESEDLLALLLFTLGSKQSCSLMFLI